MDVIDHAAVAEWLRNLPGEEIVVTREHCITDYSHLHLPCAWRAGLKLKVGAGTGLDLTNWKGIFTEDSPYVRSRDTRLRSPKVRDD